jgi:hypothetical protein
MEHGREVLKKLNVFASMTPKHTGTVTFSRKRLDMLNDGIFGVAMRGLFSTHAYRVRMIAITRHPVPPG